MKTAEQIAADEALEAAIVQCSRAYLIDDEDAIQGTITDWIVVAAEVKPDLEDPDEDAYAYNILMAGGGLPPHRQRGLLQTALDMTRPR